jgi:hypothetical protein
MEMSAMRKNVVGRGIVKCVMVQIGEALGRDAPFSAFILSEAEGSPISLRHHPLCSASGHELPEML